MSERGQITLFVALVAGALLVLAGLVVDGGEVLAARRRAFDDAQEAARAGAQALAPSPYRGGDAVVLDPEAAAAAAHGYLAAAGHPGAVVVEGDQVAVEVSFDQPLSLLRLVGIDHVTVSGHGRARAVRDVEGGDDR
ncbi:MAG: pilus assembly protein TadG-related protein [Acidimicrobiia bacterium]